MPRKPRKQRIKREQTVPAALFHYFETGDRDQSNFDDADRFDPFLFYSPDDGPTIGDFWKVCREEIIAAWIKKHPCTRPFYWWFRECVSQRKRLGGIGTPAHEVLSIAPHSRRGIPESWVAQWQVEYYNGRAKDIHGNIIPTTYTDGHFKGKAIDPEDPPAYESEAAYLDRNGLLTTGEKTYLNKHPELLAPEKVKLDNENSELS